MDHIGFWKSKLNGMTRLVDEAASVSTVASAVSAIGSGAICITTISATISSSTPSTAADLRNKVLSIRDKV